MEIVSAATVSERVFVLGLGDHLANFHKVGWTTYAKMASARITAANTDENKSRVARTAATAGIQARGQRFARLIAEHKNISEYMFQRRNALTYVGAPVLHLSPELVVASFRRSRRYLN